MNVLAFDVETTTFNKGAFSDPRNSLVCIAYDDICISPTVDNLKVLQKRIDAADVLVGFNIKFDLHWLRKVGIRFNHKKIQDVQLLEYLLSHQLIAYPSLNDTAEKYLGEKKLDEVKEYWDNGVQTTDIPVEILHKYAIQDVALTRRLHEHMILLLPESMQELYSLGCTDLLVLEEMEFNGMKYNREKSLIKAKELEKEVEGIKQKHFGTINAFVPNFNWASPQQLAVFLFGGIITKTEKEPCGFYKSGAKKGEVKYQNVQREYHCPRKYNPIGKTESGAYSTDNDTLVKIGGTGLIGDILLIRKKEKEINTYLRGLPKLQDTMFYAIDMIYGSFNQCRTKTGRLSSVKPNLQNLSDEALECFESRYD